MKVMQQWIDDEVTPYNKTITTREYLRTCTLYLENVGDHSILEFKKHHSTRFQSGLKKHGLTDAGIRKHQTHLQIFLNWAYSEEHTLILSSNEDRVSAPNENSATLSSSSALNLYS